MATIYQRLWTVREQSLAIREEFNQPSQSPTLKQVQTLCDLVDQLAEIVQDLSSQLGGF
jgi:hypothetical protein